MNILEIVGFIVLIACGVGAVLWAFGLLTVETKITKDDK